MGLLGLPQFIVMLIAAVVSGAVPLTSAGVPASSASVFTHDQPVAAQPAVSTQASAEKTFAPAPQQLTADNARDLNPTASGTRVEPLVNHGSSATPQSTVQKGASPALSASDQALSSTLSYTRPATRDELRAFDEQRSLHTSLTAAQSRPDVPNRSLGVDVASYQGGDLTKYARAGATFAIVKVTEGTNYVNPFAQAQIASAIRNRMQVDAYFFAHYGSDSNAARREANYAADNAQRLGLPKGAYFAVDWETNVGGNRTANTNAMIAAMGVLKSRGYLPLAYSGAYNLHGHLDVNAIIRAFPNSIWVASYKTTQPQSYADFNYFPSMPGVAIWQFADNFKGFSPAVDGNINVLPLNTSGSAPAPTPAPKPAPKPQPKPTPKPKDPLAGCPANPFKDAQTGWYANAVRYVNCKKVMTGYSDGSGRFGPNDELSRVDAAVLLWRRAGKPTVKTRTHYSDQQQIPGYATMAVNWAAGKKIMNGYGNSNAFGAKQTLRRQEAAKIIAEASNTKVSAPSAKDRAAYNKLENSSATTKDLVNYMVWANARHLITGWKTATGANADPWGTVSRAQMAQIMANAMQNGIFKR